MTYATGLSGGIAYTGAPTGLINPFYGSSGMIGGMTRPVPVAAPRAPVVATPLTPPRPVLRLPAPIKPATVATVKPTPTLAPVAPISPSLSVVSASGVTPTVGTVAGESSDTSDFMATFTKSPALLIALGIGALLLLNQKGRR